MRAFKPWKVMHFDLHEGIPTLQRDLVYEAIHLVLWWHDVPLGQLDITMSRLPMTDSQLVSLMAQAIAPAVSIYVLGRDLDEVSRSASMDGGERVDFHRLRVLERPLGRVDQAPVSGGNTVSVVVCTRNRPEQLAHCLASLARLEPQPQEILVVDNDPQSEATAQVVARAARVRYVREPRRGLSIARNTGIHNSNGDIVAFTDDDATAHPHWIARLQGAFDDERVMSVTGLVLPAVLDTEAQLTFEKVHGGLNLGYLPRSFGSKFYENRKRAGVPVWSIGAGANMALRRKAFELVGHFNELLGAGAAGCSEDSEFWYRLVAEGWICRYEPRAVVFHTHRREMAELRQQYNHYMRGHVCALFVQYARYGDRGNLRRAFLLLPKYYAKLILRLMRRGTLRRRATLGAEISGWIAGVFFYVRRTPMIVFGRTKARTSDGA